RWLAATHYHTFATRRLFPFLKNTRCASYNISIKHPKSYVAISNVPLLEENMDKNDMQWTRFKPTPLIPAYFIAAVVAHLAVIVENRSTKLWCRTDIIPHVQFAYIVATNIGNFLDKFLYIKESSERNHIVIQKLLGEEDIKLGFILYGEEDIIYNEKIDSEIRKIEITRVIAYKVVYEWFYNAMSPYKWEPWLIKGLAMFFGIY
ncbi:Laeverin, partial [Camponotus floridanus]